MTEPKEPPVPSSRPALPSFGNKVIGVLFALSLSNLCFLGVWFGPLYNTETGYFNKQPVNSATLLALMVNLFGFAAAAWMVLRLWRRNPRKWVRPICHFVFFCALIPCLEFVRIHVFEVPDFKVVNYMIQPLHAVFIVGLLGCLVWQHRAAAKVLAILVTILSPLAISTWIKIGALLMNQPGASAAGDHPVLPAAVAVSEDQPRVIWILFDEMDYRLCFEKPLPGLMLPEFERIRAAGLFARNAVPPADGTAMSLPALTTGRAVERVFVRGRSYLGLDLADSHEELSWSEMPTVFSEAHKLGFNSAIVGWLHPYDRLFAKDLNYCAWYPMYNYEYVRAASFGASLKKQFFSLGEAIHRRYLFGETCRMSIEASLSVTSNRTYTLSFFHLPPPHTPGIYRPEKDKFTVIPVSKPMAYRNNLILADRTLGRIRKALEITGQWEKTWLIISSDHFWRYANHYDGHTDLRIPFLLKSAGYNASVSYSREFNSLVTHDLVLAILRRDITNQAAATAWLDTHAKALPTYFDKGPQDE